jgi:hypothetical protein
MLWYGENNVHISDLIHLLAQKVSIHVEYFSLSQPSIRRTLQVNRVVPTSLPIAVNVQDYFRGTRYHFDELDTCRVILTETFRLFSKFTISNTTHQHVRIRSAQLKGPEGGIDGVRIVGSLTPERVIVSVSCVSHWTTLIVFLKDGHPRSTSKFLVLS